MKPNFRELLACAAVLTAILAGKLQIPLGRLGIEPSMWGEIRLWSLLAGAALLTPDIIKASIREMARPVVVCLCALLAYLFVRSFFDVSDGTDAKRIDLIYLFAEAILVAVAVSHPRRIAMMAYTILCLAIAYLLIAIAGQIFPSLGSRENFGLGWGPLGGPITFNRVQFLAFCVAMCLATETPRRQIFFAALGSLFLFATMASLQKAAILSAGLTLVFAATHLLWNRRYFQVVGLALIATVASIALMTLYGDRLSYRIERLTEPGLATPITQPTPLTAPKDGATLATPKTIDLPAVLPADTGSAMPDDPPEEAAETTTVKPEIAFTVPSPPQPETAFAIDAFSILMRYCVYEHPQIKGQPQPDLICPAAELNDRSTRLVFWAEALRLALDSPIFGNGIASYEVTVPNNSNMRPDTYPYPHNVILEMAAEAGAVGVVLLFIAFAGVLSSPAASPASLTTRVYVMAFMCFMFLGAMFSGDFYDSRLFWFGGIALSFWKTSEDRKTNG
jgi:hypothetical protein